MIAPPVSANEPERLAALKQYAILDTAAEDAFDELVQLAATICDVPIALISLIDEHRQWFKARVGLEPQQTPRELSFCGHAIHGDDHVFVVHDAHADPRFSDNPLVTDDPHIRFYAGAPLITFDGWKLGTLCVIDREPRVLNAPQLAALRTLGRQVAMQLELRRQEVKLRESEALFRSVADGAPMAIYRTSEDGICQYTNRRWQELSGQTFEESLGFGWTRVVHPGDLPRVIESWNEAVRDAREWNCIYRVRSPRGERVVHSRAARDHEVGGYVGTLVDITESHKAERELDRFFDVSLDLLCIAGLDGHFKRLNPAFERVLGYSMEELLSIPFIDMIHPDDRAMTREEVEKLQQGLTTTYFENRYLRKDGSTRWIAWTASPVPEEGLIYAAGRDITRAKTAEQELRHSEARTRSIIDNALGALITTNEHGIIESANPAAERLFGYSTAELVGSSFCLLFTEVPLRIEDLRDVALGRVTEREGMTRGGEIFTCELSLFEFYTTDEQRHFAAHLLDVSERHEVERMKKDFISTVSHELRTPLTSVRGSLGLLASGVMGDLGDEARQMVNVAERNSVRLIALINDILDFDKLESGMMEMDLRPTPLMRILERSIETVSAMALQEGIDIELHCANATVLGDEARLTQVTVNLLSNAVKYSHRGGVVTVMARAEDGWADVRVQDQGWGISEEQQKKLFQRFQRADASDSRNKPGTGLGLAICKAIVERHGGTIGLTSRENEGSTFWFRIPIDAVSRHLHADVLTVKGIDR